MQGLLETVAIEKDEITLEKEKMSTLSFVTSDREKDSMDESFMHKGMNRDSFDAGHELGVQEVIEQGIQGTINTCKTFGADRARTKEELLKNFDLTEEKAEELLCLYW